MEILAVIKENERDRETIIGVGQYELIPDNYLAEVAIVVKDEYQGRGVGGELLSYLTYIARRDGLLGFTAETLVENKAIVGLFEKMGFHTEKRREEGVYEMKMLFRKFSEHGREEGL
jgi:ribosomal protein S18 acetylase RimI-like enzyme